MKTKKFLFIIIAADLLMIQTNNAASQTNNTNSIEYQFNYLHVPRLTNAVYSLEAMNRMTNWARARGISPSELFTNLEVYAQYRIETYIQRHGMTPYQRASNILANYGNLWTKEWPEPSKNKERFKQFAETLRDAIDTNQVEMASNKLKGHPEASYLFKEVLNGTHASLDEFADVLETMELKAYVGIKGDYTATGSNSVNRFVFSFCSENGPFTGVEKLSSSNTLITRVQFNEKGKLRTFSRNDGNKETLIFDRNGEFWSFSMNLNDTNIYLYPDGSGSIKIQKRSLKPVVKP